MLAIFGLIASSFAVILKVLTPITVQIVIEGNIVELTEIPNIYTAWDMVITSIACVVLGSSLIYLILDDKNQQIRRDTPSIHDNWNQTLENLKRARILTKKQLSH
jgi:hypothetical protein